MVLSSENNKRDSGDDLLSTNGILKSWVSPGQRGAGAIMVGLVGEWADERGHTTSQRASL